MSQSPNPAQALLDFLIALGKAGKALKKNSGGKPDEIVDQD